MVVRPGASSAAAISFSALFLAPVTRTRPVRAVPPVTSKHSTRPPYGGAVRGPPGPGGPVADVLGCRLMTVRLTRIYTKTGDAGETHLGDMSRVAKADPRLHAFADVDEANSVLGVALALGSPDAGIADLLRSVQNDLFDVGADLCTPVTPDPAYPPLRVTAGLHRAARGGLRRVQRDAAQAEQLHPARRHPGGGAAAPGAGGRPAGRAQRVGPARTTATAGTPSAPTPRRPAT